MFKFLITDLFLGLLFHLPAVLLFLIHTFFLRNIIANVASHRFTNRSHFILNGLIADLPGNPFAVRSVAVALSLLVPSFLLQLADLLGLEVAVLPFHRAREGVGELLAILLGVLPANFNTNIPWRLVTRVYGRFPANLLHPVTTISPLLLLAVKFEGVLARDVFDFHLLILAEKRLNISTLEVVLLVDIDVVSSVADPVLDHGTFLYSVLLRDSVVVDLFVQATEQLVDVEADGVDVRIHNTGAIAVIHIVTLLSILRVASLLRVLFAFIDVDDFVLHMTICGPFVAVPVIVRLHVWVIHDDRHVAISVISRRGWIVRWWCWRKGRGTAEHPRQRSRDQEHN